jgi:hypothetical protein
MLGHLSGEGLSMLRILSVLGSALGHLVRPRTRLARAIAPLILLKITILVCARIFWFGPMTQPVVPDEVADRFVAAPAAPQQGDRP